MYWKGAVMRSVIEFTRLSEFAVIALAYTVGYLLVDYIVAPVQYLCLSRDFTVGSLLFIPHGIRVLAVLYGFVDHALYCP